MDINSNIVLDNYQAFNKKYIYYYNSIKINNNLLYDSSILKLIKFSFYPISIK